MDITIPSFLSQSKSNNQAPEVKNQEVTHRYKEVYETWSDEKLTVELKTLLYRKSVIENILKERGRGKYEDSGKDE